MAPRKKAAAQDAAPNGTANGATNGATTATTATGFIPDATPYGLVSHPLKDVHFVASGNFHVADYMPYGIEYLMSTLGGIQENRVLNCVSYCLATREDYLKNATKVRNATDKGIPVVRATWVTECDRTQTLVDVEKHTWPNVIAEEQKLRDARAEFVAAQAKGANGASGTNGTDTAADKKRPIAVANPNGAADEEEEEEEEEKPKAKKARAAPAKKPAPVKDEDEDMEDADDEAAKQLQDEGEHDTKDDDAQGAKKALVIPVDSYCHLDLQVYVDPNSGVIYDASLNQTNARNNNNKFYIVQVSCMQQKSIVSHC